MVLLDLTVTINCTGSHHDEAVPCDFNFHLPARLHLDRNLEYEAALVEIHIPVAWLTIVQPQRISVADEDGTATTLLQPAYYSTVDELVEHVNTLIRHCSEELLTRAGPDESGLVLLPTSHPIQLQLNAGTGRISVRNDSAREMELRIAAGQLPELLGMGSGEVRLRQGGYEVKESVRCLPSSLIHVFANIVAGGSQFNVPGLLRTIPTQRAVANSYLSQSFKNVIF